MSELKREKQLDSTSSGEVFSVQLDSMSFATQLRMLLPNLSETGLLLTRLHSSFSSEHVAVIPERLGRSI